VSASDYGRRLEKIIAGQIPSARISEVTHKDVGEAFEVSWRVEAARNAKSIESPFGRYTLQARREAGRAVVERRLSVLRVTVPPSDCAALRAFVEKVRSADTPPWFFVNADRRRSSRLGEIDEAFAWMEQAVYHNDEWVHPLETYPFLDLLREDPRFKTLLSLEP
jgi:hypothetical protein